MSFLKEFYAFALKRKKLWLIPLFIFLIIMGVLVVVAPSSPIAPYIYTIF